MYSYNHVDILYIIITMYSFKVTAEAYKYFYYIDYSTNYI